jgi:PKD repeat protein
MRNVLRRVCNGVFIRLGIVAALAVVPAFDGVAQSLYESYYTSDGVVAANFTNTTWIGQSFTAISDHTVTSVRIRIGKDGNPGDITVALMECWTHDFGGGYVIHNPYGVILRQATAPESAIDVLAPSTGWFEFSWNPYVVGAGRVYAIVMTSSALSTTDRYLWSRYSWGGYAGGQFVNNMQNLWQGTSSGYPDLDFEVYGNPATYIPTGTGNGPAGMDTDDGTVENLATSGVPNLNRPGDTAFPDGGYTFEVTGVTPGGTATVTYTSPDDLPVGTRWWKWDGAGNWTSLPIGSDDGDNVITVTLTDNDAWDGDPTGGTILDPSGPGFPHVVTCDFGGTPVSGPAPLNVSFTDQSSPSIDTWEWDFEDDGGVDSALEDPSHLYTTPGSYDVSLTVTSLGVTDEETKIGFVTVFAPCAADFSATPTSGDEPLTVDFTDLSTGDIDTWEWDFDGDGNVDSTDQNPTHTYDSSGSYSVRLAVSGPGGADEVTRDDYVVVAEQRGQGIPVLDGAGTWIFVILLAAAAVLVLRRVA